MHHLDVTLLANAFRAYEEAFRAMEARRGELCEAVHGLMELYSASALAQAASSTLEQTVTPYQIRHWDRKHHSTYGIAEMHYLKEEAPDRPSAGHTAGAAPA